MNRALIVFAKQPRPGLVKTRLTSLISAEDAALLYRAFLADALEQYEQVGADLRTYMADAPSGGVADALGTGLEDASETGAADVPKAGGTGIQRPHPFLQRGKTLGERMRHAFAETFAAGYRLVVIVGTDHPTLPAAFIRKAFDLLKEPQSVVVGPAEDGGFYLLGMNDFRPALFRDMTYSHGAVFDQTVERAAAEEASVSVLPTWYDVDSPEDLRRLRAELSEDGSTAPRTQRLLKRLAERYEGLGE